MEKEKQIYEETLSAAISARRMLYLSGFITEVENTHVMERIGKYKERFSEINEEIRSNQQLTNINK